MKQICIPFFFGLLSLSQGWAQQVIRGSIFDKQTLAPLTSATIILQSTNPIQGTFSDERGNFRLENVPFGRHVVTVKYLGYETLTRGNLIVGSAKEVILNLGMEEKITTAKEVEIVAQVDKMNAKNELSTVSARTFSVEEALRYAGSRNDPARMAQNFAGVSGVNDSRNDIIIRGNSPSGVLWRLEGVDVPNPNHFGTLGTTGGPVSMLNNNNLDNSDFLTGAFPAEYGNGLAGVFDLSLRSGNNEKHEFLGQIGFNGFEVGIEGPLSKNSRASYIANYRYSTLGVFKALGLDFGTGAAVPEYQDLVFKIDIPTEKAGRWTLFGMGGNSAINFLDSEESEETDLFSQDGEDLYNKGVSAVGGMTHTYLFDETTYGKFTFATSYIQSNTELDTLSILDRTPGRFFANDFSQTKFGFGYQLNKKFNAKNHLRVGALYDIYQVDFIDSVYLNDAQEYRNILSFDGQTSLLQGYAQWKHRFTDQLTLNVGLHTQYLFLNGSTAIEPRLGLQYALNDKQSISFGYGNHSQMQPTQVYFVQTRISDKEFIRTNEDLDFTKSQHFILAYDNTISDYVRIKVEAYYQNLTNIGVESEPSDFSLANAGADFGFPTLDSLTNEGTGENMGIELTVEKFFSRGYYFLVTASLFDSKYTGSDGETYNTAFNGNYILNALGGKEWKLGKRNSLSVDAKFTYAGGRRFTPIDLQASRLRRETVFVPNTTFSEQYDNYFRADLKTTFRMNGDKISQEWSVDLQNITNRDNIFVETFNERTGEIDTTYQIGLFPVVQYRIMF